MRHLILPISFLLISCQGNSTKPNSVHSDSIKQAIIADSSEALVEDIIKIPGTIPYVWFVDFENKTKERNPEFRPEYLNVDTLIKRLNQLHPNIKIDKIKTSGDTLITEIKDSEYLGERIGSYGAFAYIADVVINLTSIKNINFVKIDFEDGSHISPGTWSKKEYNNYKETH